MSDYIDADFAVVCDEWRPTVTSGEEKSMNAVEIYEKASWDLEHNKITLGEFEERIKALYDVEPVRHGRWKTVFDKIESNSSDIGYFKALPKFICSECGNEMIASTQYCPNCGARMDREDQEHE